MITSVAIRTAPKMRTHLKNLLDAVYLCDWPRAYGHLESLESSIVQHHVSRGHSCDQTKSIISEIKYWIDREVTNDGKRREIEKLIVKLQKTLVKPLPENPIEALSVIYVNLRDSWGAFIRDRTSENADMLDESLGDLYSLEPKFKEMSPDLYNGFRRILEVAGDCTSKVFLGLQETMPDKMRTSIVNSFSSLFSEISAMLAPEHYESRTPVTHPRTIEA